ncbi:MAG: MFS transporter [Candidatus Dormibacteraeota bacterium]|nr:MFS transporter [Candidatus Dormibacteraeota bacterium]
MTASSGADRRQIAITANAAVFVNFLSYLGLTPLYAQVARDLHVGASGFGQFFLVQGLINVVLQVPVGVMADRYGRRPIMLIGLLFMLAGQLLRWQSFNGSMFLAGQICIGLCGPFIVSASYALVADAYTVGRARALGILQASINVGQGTGFLFAGLLSPWLGWRGYSLCVALLPLLLLPLTATQPELRHAAPTRSIGRSIVAALRFLAIPAAASLAVVAALNLGTASGSIYLLPFLVERHAGTPTVTSLLLIPYLIGSIAGGPIVGTWADRVGVRIPALACLSAAIAGLLGLALLGYSIPTVSVCLALVGGAVSAILTLTAESVIDLARRHGTGAGAALGGIRIRQGLGPALAPAAAGVIFDSSGPTLAYLAMAVGMGIAAALVFTTAPAKRQAASNDL